MQEADESKKKAGNDKTINHQVPIALYIENNLSISSWKSSESTAYLYVVS